MENSKTFVTITNSGFIVTSEELIAQISNAMKGFSLLQANL